MPVWRGDEAGQSYALKLTAAGLKAISVDDGSEESITSRAALQPETNKASGPDVIGEHAETLTPRAGSKLAQVIDLLQRSNGATILHMREATGWLPHTTRAALTGLRKRGYVIARERIDGGDSVYRIGGPAVDGGDRLVVETEASEGHDRGRKPEANHPAA